MAIFRKIYTLKNKLRNCLPSRCCDRLIIRFCSIIIAIIRIMPRVIIRLMGWIFSLFGSS